jgi:hypothetical protein
LLRFLRPQLVGFLHGPALVPTEAPEDLFHALQALLEERDVGIPQLFEHYDRDMNGYLDRMELQRLCKRIAPKFKRGDFTFFFQLLDSKGNHRVSLKHLQVLRSDDKVANRNGRDFGWEIAHEAVSPRPPISLFTIVARTRMYTYDATVLALRIAQGPFSVAPCQTHHCAAHNAALTRVG